MATASIPLYTPIIILKEWLKSTETINEKIPKAMMTNNISLSTSKIAFNAANAKNNNFTPVDIIDTIANSCPIRTLAAMYSGLMEETISPRLTLHLVCVQVAAFFTIMPAEMTLFTRLACLAWLITSVCLAKREYCKA